MQKAAAFARNGLWVCGTPQGLYLDIKASAFESQFPQNGLRSMPVHHCQLRP